MVFEWCLKGDYQQVLNALKSANFDFMKKTDNDRVIYNYIYLWKCDVMMNITFRIGLLLCGHAMEVTMTLSNCLFSTMKTVFQSNLKRYIIVGQILTDIFKLLFFSSFVHRKTGQLCSLQYVEIT